jgi:hypothetical protein
MTKNWKKFATGKKFHVFFYLRTPKLQKKPSALKREHPALQNMTNFFLFLWVIFALLDPDLDLLTCLNPDPKYCLQLLVFIREKIGTL